MVHEIDGILQPKLSFLHDELSQRPSGSTEEGGHQSHRESQQVEECGAIHEQKQPKRDHAHNNDERPVLK